MQWVELMLESGRAAVEIALFTLLPIMVLVLCLMRLLEAAGVMGWLVVRLEPLLRVFGLTGLGLVAAMHMSFVSFAAPVAVLATMEMRGATRRQLATTLAMVLAMAQANVVFPMAAMGLQLGSTLLISWVGGLVAALVTHYLLGRILDEPAPPVAAALPPAPRSPLEVIQLAGTEAFRIATGAIPMLALALLLVAVLRHAGVVDGLASLLAPLLGLAGIPEQMVLFTLTKYLGGGMAFLGVAMEAQRSGVLGTDLLNASAGWLIHSTDLPGIAVLSAAGARTASVWRLAVLGALAGILIRTLLHACLG